MDSSSSEFKPGTRKAIDEVLQFYKDPERDFIPASKVADCLRALGIPITRAQSQKIIDQFGLELGTGEQLMSIIRQLTKPFRDSDKDHIEESIKNAFMALKDVDGVVSKRNLRHLLKNTGERLNDEELSLMDEYPDKLDYDSFSKLIRPPQHLDWNLV